MWWERLKWSESNILIHMVPGKHDALLLSQRHPAGPAGVVGN